MFPIPMQVSNPRHAGVQTPPVANDVLIILNALGYLRLSPLTWAVGPSSAPWTVLTYGFVHTDDIAEVSPWPTDRVQVGLQVLLLEEAGYTVPRAELYYAAEKHRLVVPDLGEDSQPAHAPAPQSRLPAGASHRCSRARSEIRC